ncbi:MAG: DNA sulfur modification protein DndB [Urechidicola sp.]|nr:DNA sulfur modification protein DndB [Urechidicola sp.]
MQTTTRNDGCKLILPAIRGIMGGRDYFTASMKFKDIAERIEYADEYIKFNSLISDELKKSIKPSEELQRDIMPKKLEKIVEFLDTYKEKFFSAIVVGLSGNPKWQAFQNLEQPLGEYEKKVGFLILSDTEKMYAIDGQHRVSGIKEYVKKQDADINDTVSVIFVGHERTDSGNKASRRLFTNLNHYATKISTRDIIYLSEDDIAAVITREFIEEEKGQFSNVDIEKIAKTKTANLPPKLDDAKYSITSVIALHRAVKILLVLILQVNGNKIDRYMVNNDVDIKKVFKQVKGFFDLLKNNLDPLSEYVDTKDVEDVVSKYRNKNGGHLLYRPAGFNIIIKICCELYKEKIGPVYNENKMKTVIINVSKLPLQLTDAPATSVVWNPTKKTIIGKGFPLLKNIYKYMLGSASKNEKELREQYQKTLDDPNIDLPEKLEVKYEH